MKQAVVTGAASPEGIGWATAMDLAEDGYEVSVTGVSEAEVVEMIDVGGIEYIIDDRDGELLYYDVNALSNFVADAVNVIGFNPHQRLVSYLATRAGEAILANRTPSGFGKGETLLDHV